MGGGEDLPILRRAILSPPSSFFSICRISVFLLLSYLHFILCHMDFGCRGKQRTCISFYKSMKHKASPPVLVLILKIVNHPDTLEFHMNIGTERDFGLSSLGLDKLCSQ